MSAKVTTSTARKIIGSLGVVGAAAAVAGMGTFGAFTDSTDAVAATINSGTLSINAATPAGVTLDAPNLVPGDSVTRALNLVNDGTTNLGSLTMVSTASGQTGTGTLTSDPVKGLQMSVRSCEVAWTADFTCSKGEQTLHSGGRAVNNVPLTNAYSLTAGKTDHLAVKFSLPSSADNTFQGQSANLSLVFTATQRTAVNG